MTVHSFGTFLKNIRKSKHFTQAEVCKDICSLRQYQRIENDYCETSIYLLRKLSLRLNYNLYKYYELIDSDYLDNNKTAD